VSPFNVIDVTLKGLLKYDIQWLARRCGYEIRRRVDRESLIDVSEEDMAIINSFKNYTVTSPERMHALIESIRYVIKNDIPGSIVECGVWKGGSIMIVAKILLDLNRTDKNIYLFDTFEGSVKPTEVDVDYVGISQLEPWEKEFGKCNKLPHWGSRVSLEEVKKAVYSTGYDKKKFHFVKGKVEDTLPDNAPDDISLLRLDTDWYESTRHELIHLFPRLSHGGIIIIDDYGHFQGARKAVDEYISQNNIQIMLNRIDYSGRLGVKM